MYNSLKSWINLPVTIKPFIKRSGTGSKVFGEPVETLCYAEGDVKVVKNELGEEVVSKSQLYFAGSQALSAQDSILFEGTESSIISINTFYRNGVPDLKVVYL